MKKLVVFTMLFSLMAGLPLAGRAADAPKREKQRPPVDKMVERLDKRLDLTDDQKAKAKVIMTERRARVDKLSAEIRAANEKSDAELKAILTDEQKKKFAESKDRRKDQRKLDRKVRKEKAAPAKK